MAFGFYDTQAVEQDVSRILRNHTTGVAFLLENNRDEYILIDDRRFVIARISPVHLARSMTNFYRVLADQIDSYMISRDLFEGRLQVCL